MKVAVTRSEASDRGEIVDVHEGWYVEGTVGQTGVLRMHILDMAGQVVGWEVYADGKWDSFRLVEPPTPEAVQARAFAEHQNRETGGFPNGRDAYGGNPYGSR